MKKVFMSVAVRGLTPKETVAKHEEYRQKLTAILGEYEDVSIGKSGFDGFTETKPPIYWLGKGISDEMAIADLVVFCGDISQTRGCRVEKMICEIYNIPHIVIY